VKRDELSQLSSQANAECKALFDERKLSDVGPFSVPKGDGAWALNSIGAIGGMDWGGVSIDPDRGMAFANVSNMPTHITVAKTTTGVKGNGGLTVNVSNVRFHDKNGRSCNGGRQGELVAVDLGSGKIAWRAPLGSLEAEYGTGAKDMGATSIGPTLVTRGGVVFAAASDDHFYAHDARTGKLLWASRMPASSDAGPMTYTGKDGRQYVVIAAGGPGGSRRPSPRENALYRQVLIAFALPKPGERPVDIVTPYPPKLQGPGAWPPNWSPPGNRKAFTMPEPAVASGRDAGGLGNDGRDRTPRRVAPQWKRRRVAPR
jgi:glucose dehydrogenase